ATRVHARDVRLYETRVGGRVTDLARLSALGDEGVALLMADSTNAERAGHTPSERTAAASLREIVRDGRGRVLVTSFSSPIHRLQQVIDAAEACGRTVCVI